MLVILKNERVPIWKPSQTLSVHIQIKATPSIPAANEGDRDVFMCVCTVWLK